MKFKYNFLNNRLRKIDGEYAYEISEENHFRTNHGTFGSDGFCLSPDNHWITFTLYFDKIRAFYKQVDNLGTITYFRQDIPITPLKNLPSIAPDSYWEIIFEFTEQDQVEKINGQWIRKKANFQ